MTSRLCVVAVLAALVAALGMLGGCAAADPTGGAFGESVADSRPNRPRCPPGEMLTCELKSPNRVSDGRYGYRNGKQKRCSCQPESAVLDLGQRELPTEPR